MNSFMIDSDCADRLIREQRSSWPLLDANCRALEKIEARTVPVGEIPVTLQFNPERIRSAAASVDRKAVQNRACFLCPENRPAEQTGISVDGKYIMLANPYPIFSKHLTFPSVIHTPQNISGRLSDMLDLAQDLDRYIIFYNGPRCGASAPDHMHFQAGNKGFLPLEYLWNDIYRKQGEVIFQNPDILSGRLTGWPQTVLFIESRESGKILGAFEKLMRLLPVPEGETEPMMNLLCVYEAPVWRLLVLPRRAHRPAQYFEEGDKQRLISPGAVDLGGVIPLPRKSDFDRLTEEEIRNIFVQVSLNPEDTVRICKEWGEILNR